MRNDRIYPTGLCTDGEPIDDLWGPIRGLDRDLVDTLASARLESEILPNFAQVRLGQLIRAAQEPLREQNLLGWLRSCFFRLYLLLELPSDFLDNAHHESFDDNSSASLLVGLVLVLGGFGRNRRCLADCIWFGLAERRNRCFSRRWHRQATVGTFGDHIGNPMGLYGQVIVTSRRGGNAVRRIEIVKTCWRFLLKNEEIFGSSDHHVGRKLLNAVEEIDLEGIGTLKIADASERLRLGSNGLITCRIADIDVPLFSERFELPIGVSDVQIESHFVGGTKMGRYSL